MKNWETKSFSFKKIKVSSETAQSSRILSLAIHRVHSFMSHIFLNENFSSPLSSRSAGTGNGREIARFSFYGNERNILHFAFVLFSLATSASISLVHTQSSDGASPFVPLPSGTLWLLFFIQLFQTWTFIEEKCFPFSLFFRSKNWKHF